MFKSGIFDLWHFFWRRSIGEDFSCFNCNSVFKTYTIFFSSMQTFANLKFYFHSTILIVLACITFIFFFLSVWRRPLQRSLSRATMQFRQLPHKEPHHRRRRTHGSDQRVRPGPRPGASGLRTLWRHWGASFVAAVAGRRSGYPLPHYVDHQHLPVFGYDVRLRQDWDYREGAEYYWRLWSL